MHEGERSLTLSKASLVASVAAYIAVPLALVFGSMLVGSSSYSAFSSAVTSDANFGAGKVLLSGDAPTLFNDTQVDTYSSALIADQECINVTNSSTVPTTIKFYGKSGSSSAFNSYLNFNVWQGTGAKGGGASTAGSCTGITETKVIYQNSLPNFLSTYTGFSNGLAVTLDPGQSASFLVEAVVAADLPNTAQGLSSNWSVLWEAQNS